MTELNELIYGCEIQQETQIKKNLQKQARTIKQRKNTETSWDQKKKKSNTRKK